jgi:DNA-binding NtrC family response regulator
VLETHEVRRVGGEHSIRVDARLVCATHRDLRARIRTGEFREDLYYRIAGLEVTVPPLRERPDDVRALAEHFLVLAAGAIGPRTLTEGAIDRLLAHHWPGNARELRNVVQSAAATSAGVLDANDVEDALRRIAGTRGARTSDRVVVREVLDRYGGNVAATARALGMARSTLRDRLRGR